MRPHHRLFLDGIGASRDGEVGLEDRTRVSPMHCGGARASGNRLGLFRPTKDGADKPSRFAKLGRVFASPFGAPPRAPCMRHTAQPLTARVYAERGHTRGGTSLLLW